MTDPMTTTKKYGVRYLTVTQNTNDLMGYRQLTDARFPAGRIRRALSAYGWRGKRLNDEVRRITRGPVTEWRTTGQQDGARVVYPYGWGQQELTREMRRMFPRDTRSVRFFYEGFYAGTPDFSVLQNYPRLSSFMPSARS